MSIYVCVCDGDEPYGSKSTDIHTTDVVVDRWKRVDSDGRDGRLSTELFVSELACRPGPTWVVDRRL